MIKGVCNTGFAFGRHAAKIKRGIELQIMYVNCFMKIRILLLLLTIPLYHAQAQRKTISRAELEYYLSHSINIVGLNEYCKTPDGFYKNMRVVDDAELNSQPKNEMDSILQQDRTSGNQLLRYKDVLRLISNVQPKFIPDAVTQWGSWDWRIHLNRCKITVQDIKAIDSAIIVQAAVNEYIDGVTANAVGNIPQWVYDAFGIQNEHRKFRLEDMTFPDWQTNSTHWWSYRGLNDKGQPDAIVPDISTREAKMWFYYQARIFIDMGCESINFCQVELMNNGSMNPKHWDEVFEKLRAYADIKTDIRFLLITGHTNRMRGKKKQLPFDFHSSPIRPSETGTNLNVNGGDCNITATSCDWGGRAGKIYGRSKGGIAPSGWKCKSLPGLVFIDNYGNNDTSNVWGQPMGTGTCNLYHFDEITWFALQSKEYRDNWLRYAWNEVHRLDPNIYFSPPVKRGPSYSNYWYPADYLANNPSSFLPSPTTINNVPSGLVDRNKVQLWAGYGQEDVIKELLQ